MANRGLKVDHFKLNKFATRTVEYELVKELLVESGLSVQQSVGGAKSRAKLAEAGSQLY